MTKETKTLGEKLDEIGTPTKDQNNHTSVDNTDWAKAAERLRIAEQYINKDHGRQKY